MLAIGNGSTELAQRFITEHQPTFEVFTDPSQKTYAAAGLYHNHWFSFRSLRYAVRAFRAGHRASGIHGDAKQQGGVMAVDVTGRVLYFHADEVSGDSAEPADVWMRSRNALTEVAGRQGVA